LAIDYETSYVVSGEKIHPHERKALSVAVDGAPHRILKNLTPLVFMKYA
jgi:hypothetical protein